MSRLRLRWCVLVVIVIANFAIWGYALNGREVLMVSFLDVGQGDAILIETPSGADVLIDAGRDRSALRKIGEELGPLDRTIDMVLATHPDADHIGGLPAVFEHYQIRSFASSGVESDTNPTQALAGALLTEEDMIPLSLTRGDRIYLGDDVYLDVLFPDREVASVETNTGSLVVRLVYGDTSFLLSGDAPDEIEEWLVELGDPLESTVLKAGHHGSRTSTSESFLLAVQPEMVVVSAGKDNSYGHPHPEIVERIRASGAQLYATAEEGTIRFKSDGVRVWRY